ncbi:MULTISPECIES: type VI secretion system baseplate subunit TssE [unclassified Rhizobacter]|uniref:type VI secretion system baseplate subunit TssE n=1 Tax=unclassified Rhizobacter TaxID=2640088 RepID=UPI0006FE5308|nr:MULTISPECIES: type VI secretion system baseplate subunit TssE [unclassified Rhizobacter]KQU73519.1 type VI secretion system lysozyme [Rhizobacter sp. Root29]KQV98704.1 type VI secretion system lysozyme [Rhizobacter sp. Root1238]KRB04958.1 type VI secretion system lysozyme [Rhizobacter sp. Root16D2]
MANHEVRDRLQPVLLDRLTDLDPQSRVESDDSRVMNKAQIREAVLRDLSWLLNAVKPMPLLSQTYPLAGDSVINYGLPPMSGQLASRIDVPLLERTIKQAILRFEPRVMEDSLDVKALEPSSVLDTHNVIEFEIRGFMWAQPVPLELLLRTQVDLEAGQIEVRDATSSSLKRKT